MLVARWLNVAIGVWLVFSALVIADAGSPARIADLAAGLALVAIVLLAPPGTPSGFAAIVLGSWVMVAPVFLQYPTAGAALRDVIAGFAIVALTLHPNFGARWVARWGARARA